MGKLLVIADIDDGSTSIERGLHLAQRLGHDVEVAAFVHTSLKRVTADGGVQTRIREQILAKREEQVQACIDRFKTAEQRVALKVVWLKDIHPWIVRRAASAKPDAVIKTSHKSGSFGYTSTDWHLLRECSAPVLLVAEKKWQRTRPILAALDLGTRSRSKRALNDQILGRALEMASALSVECRIIAAIEVPTLLADLDLVDPVTYAKEHREAMRPYIRTLAEAHDVPESDFHCKRGPVAKVIASEAAKVRAQLVVMGTVGRSGLKARIIGNTAEEVLQHLRTDVLALKP